MIASLSASYPFSEADVFQFNRQYKIKFTLPNGKPVALIGYSPDSVANAANEMYEKIKKKLREARISLQYH